MSVIQEFLEFVEAAPKPDLRDLLERILLKSRRLTGAEAGSIFIVRRDGHRKMLDSISIQNDRTTVEVEPLTLPCNGSSIAGYVGRTGRTVRVADAHRLPKGAPYRFNAAVDRERKFSTKSMLCFALKNHAGRVIGVVQLINRRDKAGRGPLPFSAAQAALIRPLNHFVGGAIERTDMIEQISEQNRRLAARGQALLRSRRQIAILKDQTEAAFQLSIRLLARAAELHDEDTGNHIVRVNEYSYLLASHLGLSRSFCTEIRYSAQLHDIGKMSVDQAVLKKRGLLTPAERAEMNQHPEYGYQILRRSHRLKMAAEIARCHHEKWDGSGYPRGLKGDSIPLSARIVQLADVYDALRSPRPYKLGMSHDEARRIILDGDSRLDPEGHFDPTLIALFAEEHRAMDRIWARFAD